MEAATPQQVRKRVRKVVDGIQGLPTLPSVMHSINQMVLNPHTSARELARLIAIDPALTSKILRIVNSSFYGFPSRIATITHAILILGFNTIKSIVLSSTIYDVFRRRSRPGDFDRAEFWKHSIGCGAAAKVLGQRLRYPLLEELFIAGLLHDVGKIVLDQYLPEQFREALHLARTKNIRLVEAETDVFGVNHADIGGWLFENWSLSRGLIQTTRCHHTPELAGEDRKLVEIVHVADLLTRAIRFGNGGDRLMPPLNETAWASLGLQERDLEGLLQATGAEIDRSIVYLDFIR